MEQKIPLVDLKTQFYSVKNDVYTAWDEVFNAMQLFLGPNVRAFESEFAAYCGVKYAIGVSDGTEALFLALRAAGITAGDEVISVSHTFIATGEAILLSGAKPVFVDIDPQTYLMDVDQIESKITSKTRVILPVHLYGQTADMDPIMEIANRHGLVVIEDACQAHGADYKGRKAGSIGTAAGFSFYFTKNLGAYGEGGMITTNDAELARRVRMLRDHGSEKRYFHEMIGVNGRLDELQAAVLRIKLKHLDEWNEQRRRNAAYYKNALKDLDVVTPVEALENRHVYHLYVIRTQQRDSLRTYLNELGIGTGIHYPVPIHLQRACANLGYLPGSLPVTERIVNEILSLPMYPELNDEQIELVSNSIHESLERKVFVKI
jgi:dTDP-4-amino-4,6-dideoxygalactose transaminase